MNVCGRFKTFPWSVLYYGSSLGARWASMSLYSRWFWDRIFLLVYTLLVTGHTGYLRPDPSVPIETLDVYHLFKKGTGFLEV